MCRKIVYVACVVAMLSMATQVLVANDWLNTTGDGKWSTAANWSEGIVPTMTPDSIGNPRIYSTGANACTIDGTMPQAVCQWLNIGCLTGSTGTLNVVAGGKLGTPIWGPGETWIGTDYTGTLSGSFGILNIDGAGSIAKTEGWRIGGGATSGGSAIVNITNGGELQSGTYLWGQYIHATGTVNISSGGIIRILGTDLVIDDGGVINISIGATLILNGDQRTLANGFIASGKIRGAPITENVAATFDGTNTLVTYHPGQHPAMSLRRGVVLDRQFHQIPVEAACVIHSADVKLVKDLGFDFAKVIINPELMMNAADGTINTANIWYIDEVVNKFVSQGVPVVVCIHPENIFKQTYLGDSSHFALLLNFYHDFAAYLAARWGRGQVAFELMTEPHYNYQSWNTMLPQMWNAARTAMSANIIILDADGAADIGHLINLTPVNDPNVYYSFTTYDPFIFDLQGATWMSPSYLAGLQRVPYPSSPAIIAAQQSRILDYLTSTGFGDPSAAATDLTAYGNANWNKSKMLALLAPITAWNNAHGGNLKVFCAEFGVLDANQSQRNTGYDTGCAEADRIRFIKDRRESLEESNISWAYWSLNETFTVLKPAVRQPFAANATTSWADNDTQTALGLPLCGCGCKVQPSSPYDLNKDCHVNFKDFAMFAGSWVECSEPTDPHCL